MIRRLSLDFIFWGLRAGRPGKWLWVPVGCNYRGFKKSYLSPLSSHAGGTWYVQEFIQSKRQLILQVRKCVRGFSGIEASLRAFDVQQSGVGCYYVITF